MERRLCCSPYHSYRRQGRRDWTLGSLQSCAASHTGRTGKSASRMKGKSSPVKSFETKTRLPGGLILLMAAVINPGATSHNPINLLRSPGNSMTGRLMSCSMRPQESTLLTPGGQIYILTSGDSLVLGQGGMGGENTTTMCYRSGSLLTQTRDGQQRGSGLARAT